MGNDLENSRVRQPANVNTESAEATGFGRLRGIVGAARFAGFALRASCVGGSAKLLHGHDG